MLSEASASPQGMEGDARAGVDKLVMEALLFP
jgi:hypothetical protein